MVGSTTSRERVRKALRHEQADRVPIDFGATCASGISAIAYNRLKAFLGIRGGKTRICDMWQQIARPEPAVLERFHVDCVGIAAKGEWVPGRLPDGSDCLVPSGWKSRRLTDGSEVEIEACREIARRPAGGIYFDPIYHPLQNASLEDLKDFVWPAPFSFYKLPDPANLDPYLVGLQEEARFWHRESDLALVGLFGGGIFEAAYGLRGFEEFMSDLCINRGFAEALLDRLADANIEYFKRYVDLVGPYLSVIMVGGEDIGTQTGLEISPQTYREIVLPRQKRLWQFMKRSCDAFILVHSCGAVSSIIDDLAEAGADAINPVQIGAAGMDPQGLKARFGTKITFWGGTCDPQYFLPQAGPDEIRAHVRRNMEIFKPGGGFVASPIHNLQYDVPPENIAALFDAMYEYSHYE